MATLDDEVLVRLVTGSGQETKYAVMPRLPKGAFKSTFNGSASGKTTNLFAESLGIPACSLADGPAGLHLMGTPTTAYPVGMVLAQTFNQDILYEIGDAYGKEMEYFDIALCLGPGMNIHRDPLCGRNFEYYSEDPIVSGYSAAAFINGLQNNHPGFGVAAKHFCCNNQELDRAKSNSSVSERALREIYLKGFEIAVKLSQPATIMSSYNLLNGIHTSSRYDLLTDVLRGEWGFEGFVMTDWEGDSDRIADLQAGNDILMGGYSSDELMACVQKIEPTFNEDGSVEKKTIKMYGGMLKKEVECWGSFLLDKEGTDTYIASYKETIGSPVKELIEKGLAEIDRDKHQVIYKGYDRSYSLSRSILQRNVLRILKYYVSGAPMKLAKRK
ncbi:MAG: glycoside hydrolase family 3 protein [Solobacterium sp.]|nr:glycoside hydrolase family 3 protein [Solobacterium sp.]